MMRWLSPADVPGVLGTSGFTAEDTPLAHAQALRLDGAAHRQFRAGGSPPDDLRGLRFFLEGANRWLPAMSGRVVWISHFQSSVRGDDAFLMAFRRGCGESRPVEDVPGCYFDAQRWDEQDQTEMTPEHGSALSMIVGLTEALLVTGSDGWLVAEGSPDRIEFWEGNIFFHSSDRGRLHEARALLDLCGPAR